MGVEKVWTISLLIIHGRPKWTSNEKCYNKVQLNGKVLSYMT